MTKKKTLIINYSFPPNPGVGGRRWAKFCKYLHQSKEDFIVVCKKPDQTLTPSKWLEDTEQFMDKIRFFDFGYPTVLEQSEFKFFDKLKYRLALQKVKLYSKGNYYDRACLSENKLKSYVRDLVEIEGVTTIVVSVAPFGIAKYIGELKSEFNDIKFIVDFRDPWIDNETAYGMSSMDEQRRTFESESEKNVINNFDAIVSVSEVMTNNLRKRYPDQAKDKFYTLLNGFDYEDVSKEDIKKDADKINLVFMGTFYEKASHHIKTLVIQLKNIKEHDFELYKKISINFYGAKPIELKGFETVLVFHEAVPINQVSRILSASDIGLLFLSDDINYSFSTKFCEYLAHKLPIIVFSKPGKTGEFIENNKIGIEIFENSETDKLQKMLLNKSEFQCNIDKYDSSSFNIKGLTSDYQKLINN